VAPLALLSGRRSRGRSGVSDRSAAHHTDGLNSTASPRGRKGDILLFRVLPGAAAGAEGGFETELAGRGLHPVGAAVGRAPGEAVADRLQLRLGLRAVDVLQPTAAARHRAGVQRRPVIAGQRRKGDILLFLAAGTTGSVGCRRHRMRRTQRPSLLNLPHSIPGGQPIASRPVLFVPASRRTGPINNFLRQASTDRVHVHAGLAGDGQAAVPASRLYHTRTGGDWNTGR
jgi:hypothetical protein